MVLYSKLIYGSEFSGEKKRFENPVFGCRDIKPKWGHLFLGHPVHTDRNWHASPLLSSLALDKNLFKPLQIHPVTQQNNWTSHRYLPDILCSGHLPDTFQAHSQHPPDNFQATFWHSDTHRTATKFQTRRMKGHSFWLKLGEGSCRCSCLL